MDIMNETEYNGAIVCINETIDIMNNLIKKIKNNI